MQGHTHSAGAYIQAAHSHVHSAGAYAQHRRKGIIITHGNGAGAYTMQVHGHCMAKKPLNNYARRTIHADITAQRTAHVKEGKGNKITEIFTERNTALFPSAPREYK